MEDKPARRRPRSDGQRNRTVLIETAKAAFTEGNIDIRMDEVARRAGVGIGTLYRHFPNRDALIEAVYRTELGRLADAAGTLPAAHAPLEALRAWLYLFIDYMEAKQIIAPALGTLVGDPCALYARSATSIQEAVAGLAHRAIQSGDIRPDLDPMDLLRAIAGVCTMSTGAGWATGARRVADVLLKGARPEA